MITYILQKLLLFLVLITHMAMPMDKQPLHTITHREYGVTQERIDAILMFENMVNVGILTVQAASMAWLKKNHCLFGTELIPENIDIPCTSFAIGRKLGLASCALLGLYVTAIFGQV